MSKLVRQAYSVREAAEVLGVSSWLVRQACREGTIDSIRMRGRILIPRRALQEFLGMGGSCESADGGDRDSPPGK